MWWLDPNDNIPPIPKEALDKKEKETLDWNQKMCNHKWIKTTLIISVVEDCEKCNAKKENWEAHEKTNRRL